MGRKISIENGIENIRTPKTDWSKIPIDTKVIVTSTLNGKDKYNRYFAGVDKEGKPMVFSFGKTSFTATNGFTEYWNKIELYKEELLNMDVVCVKGGSGFNLATIYAVRNGIIKGCDYKFKNIEELNSYFVAKFTEKVTIAGLKEEYEKYLNEEQPSKYNDTIICVKTPTHLGKYFTEGKIYEIKNGEITLDTGIKLSTTFSNIKDLNRRIIGAEFSTVINKSIPLNLGKHFTIGTTYEVKDGMISTDLQQCGVIVSGIEEFNRCFKDSEGYKLEELLQSNIDFISKQKVFWDGNKTPCDLVATKYKLSLYDNGRCIGIRLEESDGIHTGIRISYKEITKQECIALINKKFLNKYDLELVLEKKYKLCCSKNLSEEEIIKLEEMSIRVEEIK